MVIVDWKKGNYSFQTWGKIGTPWGLGEMVIGYTQNGTNNPFFGVYQRRRGRKKQIIVKTIYQIPPDPMTPRQLSGRYYMKSIIEIYHNLSTEELAILARESKKVALNRQQIFARYMQLERPSDIGAMQLGFSNLGELTKFVNL